jgi:hypothetical protein
VPILFVLIVKTNYLVRKNNKFYPYVFFTCMKKALFLLLFLPSLLFSQNTTLIMAGVETPGYFLTDALVSKNLFIKSPDKIIAETKTLVNESVSTPIGETNSDVLSAEVMNFCYECGCIKWSTASEVNCSHFLVMFSRDNKGWNILGQVYGAGNSSVMNHYKYPTDLNNVYFKIYQMDFNGEAREYQSIFGSCKKQKKN